METDNGSKTLISFSWLAGMRLTDIGHAANMIWLTLAPDTDNSAAPSGAEAAVHIQAAAEIRLNGQYITGTEDLNKDPSVFLGKIDAVRASILQAPLESAEADGGFSLTLRFSSGLTIITDREETFAADDERWRIFLHHSDLPHLVAMGDHIEI